MLLLLVGVIGMLNIVGEKWIKFILWLIHIMIHIMLNHNSSYYCCGWLLPCKRWRWKSWPVFSLLMVPLEGAVPYLEEVSLLRKAIGGALDSQRTREVVWDAILWLNDWKHSSAILVWLRVPLETSQSDHIICSSDLAKIQPGWSSSTSQIFDVSLSWLQEFHFLTDTME